MASPVSSSITRRQAWSQVACRAQLARPGADQNTWLCQQRQRALSRSFHGSAPSATALRRAMFDWLKGPGTTFKSHRGNGPNYLGLYDRFGRPVRSDSSNAGEANGDTSGAPADTDGSKSSTQPPLKPFPANKEFRSQPVLSEELRDRIYQAVVEEGKDLATTSAEFSVEMRRVAAVVRLKTIENNWTAQGKKLATPYASAVMAMLPQTRYDAQKPSRHEPINDLPVHPATTQQIFYPTSESRQFTRADAAKVFHPRLLAADERIPHPDLIQAERDLNSGLTKEERYALIKAKDEAKQRRSQFQEQRRRDWEAENLKTVSGQRWDFKITNISVDAVGKDGRGVKGVGARYGVPHQDRKRGLVKICTSV